MLFGHCPSLKFGCQMTNSLFVSREMDGNGLIFQFATPNSIESHGGIVEHKRILLFYSKAELRLSYIQKLPKKGRQSKLQVSMRERNKGTTSS